MTIFKKIQNHMYDINNCSNFDYKIIYIFIAPLHIVMYKVNRLTNNFIDYLYFFSL